MDLKQTEIEEKLKKVRETYLNDPRQKSFNLLLLGEMGSGKTYLLRTARKPVLIDSFDPGGTKALRDLVEKGDVYVNSFESEDPKHPTAFKRWKENFEKMRNERWFSYFGTYCIDSLTTWSDAIMNSILAASGIAGQAPRFTKDYVPQKVEIQNTLRLCLDLPCDFVLTGHLKIFEEDENDKAKLKWRLMTTGQGVTTVPLLFDEIYVMDPKSAPPPAGVTYRILTAATGAHLARTRLKGLSSYEEPDICKLLAKAGYSITDKRKM